MDFNGFSHIGALVSHFYEGVYLTKFFQVHFKLVWKEYDVFVGVRYSILRSDRLGSRSLLGPF